MIEKSITLDDHSSRATVASRLKRPTRTSGRNLPFARRHCVPIWSCSRWGLPCRPCCQWRGALLPHRFTLTIKKWRFVFCGTFPEVALAGRYPASWFRGARTFLCKTAVIQPSDLASYAVIGVVMSSLMGGGAILTLQFLPARLLVPAIDLLFGPVSLYRP